MHKDLVFLHLSDGSCVDQLQVVVALDKFNRSELFLTIFYDTNNTVAMTVCFKSRLFFLLAEKFHLVLVLR